ncbi:MAG: lipopolysaccharide export system protein LptC [Halomonadaceae bacterium T82-2]|nr:MAG: lipopolysaccharide export system protein LptC [Halomonadaceae bacterium T82-2]
MTLSRRRLSTLLLGLLLLGLGGVLTLIDQRDVGLPGPVPTGETGEPDYYLENARLTRFDATGRAYQYLTTPRIEHTPGDDVTRLETPRARLDDKQGRTWLATADKGRLEAGGNPLVLIGHARLRAPEEGWQATSDVLHYDADTYHAWSDSRATLRQYRQRVSGDRLDAWIDTGRMRLNGDVQGFHPPISPQGGT